MHGPNRKARPGPCQTGIDSSLRYPHTTHMAPGVGQAGSVACTSCWATWSPPPPMALAIRDGVPVRVWGAQEGATPPCSPSRVALCTYKAPHMSTDQAITRLGPDVAVRGPGRCPQGSLVFPSPFDPGGLLGAAQLLAYSPFPRTHTCRPSHDMTLDTVYRH